MARWYKKSGEKGKAVLYYEKYLHEYSNRNGAFPQLEEIQAMEELCALYVGARDYQNAKIEGFSIGGKTATSQTLPRSDHKYISSFLGFAPADDPKVLVLVVINDPKGTYYGGQIAAPVAKEIMENILPYLAK